jgi:hypothetical protein
MYYHIPCSTGRVLYLAKLVAGYFHHYISGTALTNHLPLADSDGHTFIQFLNGIGSSSNWISLLSIWVVEQLCLWHGYIVSDELLSCNN